MADNKKEKTKQKIPLPELTQEIPDIEPITTYIKMLTTYVKKKQPNLIHRYQNNNGYRVTIQKIAYEDEQ